MVSVSADNEKISIEGDMNIFNAMELKDRLLDAVNSVKDVLLDLSHVSEFDSSGVQLLLMCRQEALKQEKTFGVIDESAAVKTALELYNMRTQFERQ